MLSQEASLLSSSENGLDRTWERGTLLLNTINNQVCRVLATVKWQKYVPKKNIAKLHFHTQKKAKQKAFMVIL